MPRSSEESPGQAALPGLTDENEILDLPEPDQQIEPESSDSSDEPPQTSTLIEFPGLTRRYEPPWRKELSRRVREAQERRSKEASEIPVLLTKRQPPPKDPVLSQLELVPELPTPAMNQLVENALRRVERARRAENIESEQSSSTSRSSSVSRHGAATAVARAKAKAPVPELTDAPAVAESTLPEAPAKKARSLTRRKLVVVTPPELVVVPSPELVVVPSPEPEGLKSIAKPVRVIADEDAALSYLDQYFPEAHNELPINRAGFLRRVVSGVFDLVFVMMLVAPFAAGIEVANGSWTDPRIVILMIGAVLAVMLAYQIFSTALRGQTWGMRLLSICAVDAKTGLIPTGAQSIRRGLGYLLSFATLGLGFLYVLFDSDHLAPHDRFSRTIVVRR